MFALTCFVTFSVILLLSLLYHWWKNRNFYYLARKIPQVSGKWPLIGHLPYTMGKTPAQQYLFYIESTKPGPSPRKYWLGPVLFVVVDDPDQLQTLLTSKDNIDKPFIYDALLCKKGLVCSGGSLWRSHRKLCDPAFNINIIKSFLPIFNENSQILIKILNEKVAAQEFDIYHLMAPYSLDNIIGTSMGLDSNCQSENNNEFMKSVYQTLILTSAKLTNIWLLVPFIYRLTKYYKLEQKHIVNGLMKIPQKILLQKEKEFEDGTFVEDSRKPQIFIDQLFKKRDVFTKEEISDEVVTVMATGFETITTTLSTIILLMALHPEVQDKVFKELQEVFDSQDEEVCDEKMDKLLYMDLVIKEAMRFWPPVGIISRYVSKDMQLGDRIVPAGANFMIPIVHVHRDKKLWGQDADKFRPERFLPEEHSKVHPYAYFPFSRGPRNCIGYRYALKSMKVAMSYLFRQFIFTTTMNINEIEFEFLITSRIKQGCNVSIERRDFQSRK